jgi:hypothetical protein
VRIDVITDCFEHFHHHQSLIFGMEATNWSRQVLNMRRCTAVVNVIHVEFLKYQLNIRPRPRERGDSQSKARNLPNTFRIHIELRCLIRGFFASAGRTTLKTISKGWASCPKVGNGKVRDRISIPNVGENGSIERSQQQSQILCSCPGRLWPPHPKLWPPLLS